MSISLKVVSNAVVWRSEMRRGIRFIFARVSFLPPGAVGGGVYSGLESVGQDGSGRFCLNLWWGVAVRFLAAEGRYVWGFQLPGLQLSPDPREPSRLGP